MARETTITLANGASYRLSKFDAQLQQEYCDWAKEFLPDPVKEILPLLKDLPKDLAEMALKDALKTKKLRGAVNDPDLLALMATPKGTMKLYSLMFAKHHGNLPASEVEEILLQYKTEKEDEALAKVQDKIKAIRDSNLSEEEKDDQVAELEEATISKEQDRLAREVFGVTQGKFPMARKRR